MAKFINKASDVLTLAQEHPIWAIATAGVVLAVPFIINVIVTSPQYYIEQKRNSLRFERYVLEGERVEGVFLSMATATKSIAVFYEDWTKHFADKKFPEPSDMRVVENTYQLAANAKKQCSVALGVLRGLSFETEHLQQSRVQLVEAMEKLEAAHATMEAFILAHAQRDGAKVKELLPKMREAAETSEQVGIQLSVGMSAFGIRAQNLSRDHQLDIEKEIAAHRLQVQKEGFAVVLGVFVLGYGILILRACLKSSKPANPELSKPL